MFIGGTGETVNSTHILELALMKLSERVKWVPKRVYAGWRNIICDLKTDVLATRLEILVALLLTAV